MCGGGISGGVYRNHYPYLIACLVSLIIIRRENTGHAIFIMGTVRYPYHSIVRFVTLLVDKSINYHWVHASSRVGGWIVRFEFYHLLSESFTGLVDSVRLPCEVCCSEFFRYPAAFIGRV